MRTLMILLLITVGPVASGTKYYVSNSSGNDTGNDGKSPSTAWKTLAKISNVTFAPGDTVLLLKGDTWRETLTVPTSGTVSAYVVFGSYGTGVNPRILGSEVSSGWTNYSGNVWVSNTSFSNPRSSFNCDIFFIASTGSVTFGLNKTGITALASEYDWTWSGNKIYVYSPVNPSTRYAGVEIPQRQCSIDLNNREYLGINGINMFYGIYEGITYDWNYPQLNLHGLVIEKCEIGFIGGSITNLANENGFGIDAAYSDMTVRNCEIHDCGRRGISFHLYGSGFTVRNVLIEQNYFHNGYHTTGVDISVGSGSYTGSFDNVTIRRNMFYDPPTSPYHSEQIFIQNYNYATLTTSVNNINIYSNIFRSPSSSSIMIEGTQSVYIYNNTFYNHNTTKTGSVVHLWIDANNALIKVKNNIFYTDLTNDTGGNGLAIFSLTDFSKIEADYNLYFRTSGSLNIIKTNGTSYTGSQLANLRTATGWETHSPGLADPKFTNQLQNDYTLLSTSPAIGKGLYLSISVDYAGNVFANPPNIGCYSSTGGTADIPPVVSITSPANNSAFTSPASFTITASASDPDGTVSKVEFYNGTALLGVSSASPYSFGWNSVPAGTYTLTAVATDNSGTKTTSQGILIVVSAELPPVVSITSPLNKSTFKAPASFTITASASDPDGSVSRVEFYNGTALLGVSSASPYSFVWNSVPAGTYSLTAVATDNSGTKTTSTGIQITVSPDIPPLVSITSPANNSTFIAPASLTITASASDPDGTVSKVEFYNGATLVGVSSASPYSLDWNNVPAGAYTLTAVATDNDNKVTTSQGVQIAVSVITVTNESTLTSQDVDIYPNPNDGNFTVRLKKPIDYDMTIDIVDMSGKKIYSEIWFTYETLKTFYLSYIPKGFYIVRLYNLLYSVQKKLIKK